MKWFDRWFAKKAKWAWENHDRIMGDDTARREEYGNHRLSVVSPRIEKTVDHRHSMNMKLMPATGGSILEIHWYDDRKDHHLNDLYIIDDEQDLAPQLASIIMQHKMRH